MHKSDETVTNPNRKPYPYVTLNLILNLPLHVVTNYRTHAIPIGRPYTAGNTCYLL